MMLCQLVSSWGQYREACFLSIQSLSSPTRVAVPNKYTYYTGKGKWCGEPVVVLVLCSGQGCGETDTCVVADFEGK